MNMATIKDIAKKMNLGVSTVSMALNNNPKISEATRKDVMRVARDLGYVKNGLAADLQRGRSNLILVVVDDASRPYFSRFINIVQKRVTQYGFDLLITTTFTHHPETAKRYISEHRGAGALIFTMNIDDDFIRQYANADFPIYVFGRNVYDCDHVYDRKADSGHYYDNGYLSTKYLINQGFKNIAFVRVILNTLGTTRRFEGYLQALNESEIEYDEELVFDCNPLDGQSFYDIGYNVTKLIIAKKKNKNIEAVYYYDDSLALGGMRCFHEANIQVPEMISIIGNGNFDYSSYSVPALTTVGNTSYETIYNYAVDVIVAAIENRAIEEIDSQYQESLEQSKEVVFERETVANK